jgi:hypothetical protein
VTSILLVTHNIFVMPVFSRLLPVVGSAYALQAGAKCCNAIILVNICVSVFASVFVPRKTEKYYDLCGALGWMTTTFVSLYYPDDAPVGLPSFAPRQLLVTAAVGIWSVRLGSFLALVYDIIMYYTNLIVMYSVPSKQEVILVSTTSKTSHSSSPCFGSLRVI